MNKPIRIAGLILGSACLFLLLTLGLISWWYGDDYAHGFFVQDYDTIFGYALRFYMGLDGRAFALSNLTQNFLLKHFTPELASLVWTFGFFVLAWALVKILRIEQKNRLDGLFVFTLVLAVQWIGMIRHLGTTLYWVTGGYYSFNATVFVLWYLFYSKHRTGSWQYAWIPCILATFLASNTMPNLSFGVIVLLAYDALIGYLQSKSIKETLKKYTPYLTGAGIGLLVLMLSPGNNGRINRINEGSYETNPIQLAYNFMGLLKQYTDHANLLLFFTCIAAVVVFFSSRFQSDYKEMKLLDPDYLKWVIAALATIVPMATFPKLARIRTEIYFDVFLMVFVFELTMRVLHLIQQKLSFPRLQAIGSEILGYAFLILFVVMLYQHNTKSMVIYKEMDLLLEQLEPYINSNKSIKVKRFSIDYPIAKRSRFLRTDSLDHANVDFARYYGLQSVSYDVNVGDYPAHIFVKEINQ